MRDLIDARVKLDSRINDLRSIARRIQTPQFEAVYEQATPEMRKEVIQYITLGSKELIQAWYHRCVDSKIIEAMSMRELRSLGSKYKIVNYSRMSRSELIQLIVQKERSVC